MTEVTGRKPMSTTDGSTCPVIESGDTAGD